MTRPRIVGGPMPKDVLPPSPEERYAAAEKLTRDLRRLAINEGHQAMVLGQILHDVHRQELWREMADSWKEYVNDVGLSQSMEFQARKNYQTFVLELGMDPTDRRLSEAPPSKLFIGTRSRFKAWVAENIDEFLDYARLPLGEGGLTRADLYRLLEEKVGIRDDSEDSLVRKALRALRQGAVRYRSLADDSWSVFIEALRNDEELFDTLSAMVAQAAKLDEDIEVVLE
jgi:hypothetical protein